MALDYDGWTAMLRGGAALVRENQDVLSKLDSVGGDGDHGTTMMRAMGCLETALTAAASRGLDGALHAVGWAILGVDGGAVGPLLGGFFMAMAPAVEGRATLDAADLARVFEAGLAGVLKQTKARPGDKTMVDALQPAVEALRQAADRGMTVEEALRNAAEAAERGAQATKDMQAKFGRAKNIKEQSIGSPDAGATSIALLFRGFSRSVG